MSFNKAFYMFHVFVHNLQMNCNSAWQDHRYRSVDIKCIQKPDEHEPKQQDKRHFCHQAALPLSRQSQCSSLSLPHETIREGETLHWYLNLQNYDHKNKALDL